MKELSIEEKAKAYNGLIERLKDLKFAYRFSPLSDTIEEKFPELRENNNEKVRVKLIEFFKGYSPDKEWWGNITQEDILSWFEKQGEQNHVDNVEPKFKVGDWVIDKQDIVHQIANVIENVTYHTYGYDIVGGGYFNDNTEGVRLWTIQDAKDGDVLVASDNSIFLFKCTIGCACKHYVALTTDDVVKFNEGLEHFWETSRAAHPATKEQRDTLMKAMADAGYTFDFKKKKLKKIENKNPLLSDFFKDEYERGKADAQNSVWSEDDENMLECTLDMIEWYAGKNEDKSRHVSDWLKSIKDRVQPQSKQEWSEEDKNMLQSILDEYKSMSTEKRNWLKSLKDKQLQSRWKPSDEQIKAFIHLFDGHLVGAKLIPKDYDNLKLLLEQLKKLREELL